MTPLLRAIAIITFAMIFTASTRAAEPVAPQPRGDSHVTRIWLSQASLDARRVTISWESTVAEDSVVELRATSDPSGPATRIARDEKTKHHAVEITPPVEHGPWYYRVGGTEKLAPWVKARGMDEKEFRAIVVGDIGYAKRPWAAAVMAVDPHLVLTAGDNVAQLHAGGKPAAPGDASAFQRLIDQAQELFEAVPFLPVLGNHDREIRPRGPKPPAEPVYDVAAAAFRKYFALPGNEWCWHHDVPAFGVRFVAVDLNHTQDFGTTWQTCHDYGPESEQLLWYRDTMAKSTQPYVITIYNEKHSAVRGLAKGAWWPHVLKSSAVVTGFGYFAERSEHDGVPCFNTSLSGKGDKYPDPKSAVLKSEDSFLLLTFRKDGPANVELRSLDGELLDEIALSSRKQAPPLHGENGKRVVTQPLVLREGGTAEKPAVFDGAGMVIDLGIDVTDHAWRREGYVWHSHGRLLGRESIGAGQIAGLFIDEMPLAIPRDVATELKHPDRKTKCYFPPEALKPGQMGYAADGALYFRWPEGKKPGEARIITPPAPGTNGVSIQCSHITVRNVTCKYAANDGFNIHGAYVGIRLENVRALSNADEGISAHDDVQMEVDGAEIAWNGSAAGGVADVNRCTTSYRNCQVHDNLGAAFYLSGKSHRVTDATIWRQARDFSVNPTSHFEQARITRK